MFSCCSSRWKYWSCRGKCSCFWRGNIFHTWLITICVCYFLVHKSGHCYCGLIYSISFRKRDFLYHWSICHSGAYSVWEDYKKMVKSSSGWIWMSWNCIPTKMFYLIQYKIFTERILFKIQYMYYSICIFIF